VRQSAFADAKEWAAAHLRASSKRAAPLFRPFGPDAPAGHERPLSRDTNFLALHLPDDLASQEQNSLVVFAPYGWRFASQEQNGLVAAGSLLLKAFVNVASRMWFSKCHGDMQDK